MGENPSFYESISLESQAMTGRRRNIEIYEKWARIRWEKWLSSEKNDFLRYIRPEFELSDSSCLFRALAGLLGDRVGDRVTADEVRVEIIDYGLRQLIYSPDDGRALRKPTTR